MKLNTYFQAMTLITLIGVLASAVLDSKNSEGIVVVWLFEYVMWLFAWIYAKFWT